MSEPILAPPHVQVYERALGSDLAVDLILELGGSMLYVARSPEGGSRVAKIVGLEPARRLAEELAKEYGHTTNVRVPLAKPWLARHLKARQLSIQEIARTLKATDSAVRKWIPTQERGTCQLELF